MDRSGAASGQFVTKFCLSVALALGFAAPSRLFADDIKPGVFEGQTVILNVQMKECEAIGKWPLLTVTTAQACNAVYGEQLRLRFTKDKIFFDTPQSRRSGNGLSAPEGSSSDTGVVFLIGKELDYAQHSEFSSYWISPPNHVVRTMIVGASVSQNTAHLSKKSDYIAQVTLQNGAHNAIHYINQESYELEVTGNACALRRSEHTVVADTFLTGPDFLVSAATGAVRRRVSRYSVTSARCTIQPTFSSQQ
jgi:hypothetical protein